MVLYHSSKGLSRYRFSQLASTRLASVRYKIVACMLLLWIAPLWGEAAPSEANVASKPNILFCLADDWGWAHAGAYGDRVVQTPTFDRLAKEGALFDQAYVSSPSCTPSRNAMLTGQQFYRLDAGANLWSTLDAKHPNFMFLLREAGYQIGHWRKAWGPGYFEKGGYKEHPCGPESEFASFMASRDKDQPFCFWFGTSDPHRPYERGIGKKSGIPLDQIELPAFYPDTEAVRSDIADYYYEVQRWDREVGEALRLLEKEGLLDNTIIVMTSDNGMPFPRCKSNLYDWGTRMPMAIRWRGEVQPGTQVTDFVSLTDLAPTFLALAGVDIPQEMTGQSLGPILKAGHADPVDAKRDFVVFGRERHVPAQKKPSLDGYPSRAIRTDQWLLILNLESERWPAGVPSGSSTSWIKHYADCDDGPTKSVIRGLKEHPNGKELYELSFGKRPPVELYDCLADPAQTNNLAAKPEHAETIEQLRTQLVDYLKETEDPRFTGQPVKFDGYPFR